jgi:hypothetical protein
VASKADKFYSLKFTVQLSYFRAAGARQSAAAVERPPEHVRVSGGAHGEGEQQLRSQRSAATALGAAESPQKAN